MRIPCPALLLAIGVSLFATTSSLWAHCDGLDGPVVTAARKALDTGNIDHVLIWVTKADENEVRSAFADARKVRQLNDEAQALADKYFFETVVRLHRAAEGASYTGLKPAGRDLGPAIPAADAALRAGSPDELVRLLTETVRHGVHARFEAAKDKKSFAPGDVAAGREYVDAYVTFIHYVERLHEAAARAPEGHYPEEH